MFAILSINRLKDNVFRCDVKHSYCCFEVKWIFSPSWVFGENLELKMIQIDLVDEEGQGHQPRKLNE